MFNVIDRIIETNRNARRVVCLVSAAVIVALSLGIGALGAQSAGDTGTGYSVTVTELQ